MRVDRALRRRRRFMRVDRAPARRTWSTRIRAAPAFIVERRYGPAGPLVKWATFTLKVARTSHRSAIGSISASVASRVNHIPFSYSPRSSSSFTEESTALPLRAKATRTTNVDRSESGSSIGCLCEYFSLNSLWMKRLVQLRNLLSRKNDAATQSGLQGPDRMSTSISSQPNSVSIQRCRAAAMLSLTYLARLVSIRAVGFADFSACRRRISRSVLGMRSKKLLKSSSLLASVRVSPPFGVAIDLQLESEIEMLIRHKSNVDFGCLKRRGCSIRHISRRFSSQPFEWGENALGCLKPLLEL